MSAITREENRSPEVPCPDDSGSLFDAAKVMCAAIETVLQGIECRVYKLTAPVGNCDCWWCTTSKELHEAVEYGRDEVKMAEDRETPERTRSGYAGCLSCDDECNRECRCHCHGGDPFP